MPVETIRLSEKAREQLLSLRKSTGIGQWNILCRWAFLHSLRTPKPPIEIKVPADSSVEMTWKVFGGKFSDLYWALLRSRVARDGGALVDDNLALQLRLHLHRGIEALSLELRKKGLQELLETPATNDRQVGS